MKNIIIIVFILITPIFVFSQKGDIRKANINYEMQNYFEAIKSYNKIVKKGNATPEIIEKLANANFFNANYEQANVWYSKLSQFSVNMKSEVHYRYALTLKSIGKQDDAKVQLELFKNLKPNEIRTSLLNEDDKNDSKFVFSNSKLISVNSKYSDYGPALYNGNLIFSSSNNVFLKNSISGRTNQYRTNLYQSTKSSNGEYSKPKLFSNEVYSIFNEATPVFSRDGKTIYYTQNFTSSNSNNKLINGGFKLYKSVLINNKWINKGQITFGLNDTVRVAHPTLSPDGKFIYFASDYKTKYGESDLFRARISDDNNFGPIENLGDHINTEGRDSYPFITEDNTLIFASDGRPGIGGFDLYSIDLNDAKSKVTRLGDDINSPYDDFGIVINNEMTSGYYTSNKPGGIGDDDIYSFDLTVKKVELIAKRGTIIDEETKKTVSNVEISLFDNNKVFITKTKSDSNGNFSFNDLNPSVSYSILVKNNDYEDKTILLDLIDNKLQKDISIKSSKFPYNTGDDLSEILNINYIYFNLGKYTLKTESKIELDKIVAFLNKYSSVKIEIGSHTDSRKSDNFNILLSVNRAKETFNYLVMKGIDPKRLFPVGYGESKIINECKDGVPCSEAQHQQNRRSTFVIIN